MSKQKTKTQVPFMVQNNGVVKINLKNIKMSFEQSHDFGTAIAAYMYYCTKTGEKPDALTVQTLLKLEDTFSKMSGSPNYQANINADLIAYARQYGISYDTFKNTNIVNVNHPDQHYYIYVYFDSKNHLYFGQSADKKRFNNKDHYIGQPVYNLLNKQHEAYVIGIKASYDLSNIIENMLVTLTKSNNSIYGFNGTKGGNNLQSLYKIVNENKLIRMKKIKKNSRSH